ncbi:hypothetical protein OPQ81_000273 [Rhizoctonia solani]|nr:hypothetical protein OPQ81_000273 [Rhizoctonia solani]
MPFPQQSLLFSKGFIRADSKLRFSIGEAHFDAAILLIESVRTLAMNIDVEPKPQLGMKLDTMLPEEKGIGPEQKVNMTAEGGCCICDCGSEETWNSIDDAGHL